MELSLESLFIAFIEEGIKYQDLVIFNRYSIVLTNVSFLFVNYE